jgi:predicted acyl esterase
VLAVAGLTAACTTKPLEEDLSGDEPQAEPPAATTTTEPLPELVVSVRPGPYQLTIDGVPDDVSVEATGASGATLQAIDSEGNTLAASGIAPAGTAILRDLPPGEVTVLLVDEDGTHLARTDPVVVPGGGPVDEATYGTYRHDGIRLDEGFTYIPTRDGTELSAFVSLPGPADQGPYPTLVEYSGYGPSRPDTNDPGRLLITTLGYALVQVNLRGTGCSGGSFDAFEPVQGVDGYDVIETVAAQDWSGSVGMYGISYAGIMQLQVAANRPPSLAAIAPLSVIDDVGSVLLPGGVYNDGFGESWTRRVSRGAEAYGQGWERDRVEVGDDICERNQDLRVHNPDLIDRVRSDPFVTDLTIARSPIGYVDQIEVPVFLAGSWQDEQTGGRWPALIDGLAAAPTLRVTLFNGLHGDSVAPELLTAVTEFYDLHLDDPSPGADPLSTLAIGAGLASFYGEVLPVSFNRFDPADAAGLRADYAADDPIHVLFELGADRPNLPVSSFEATFDEWPPDDVDPTAYTLVPTSDGLALVDTGSATGLGTSRGRAAATASFTTDPDEGGRTTSTSAEQTYSSDPDWDWPAAGEANRITATTDALTDDLVLVGPASADLWVSANSTDAEIEVTISEVAPDGSETYVQNGWLRLSRRALDPSATALRPVITGREADIEPLLPGGEPVLARVEILPFAHVFRAGSRLRLTVDTPGASRPEWRFDVIDQPVEVTLHTGAGGDDGPVSQLTLPVLPGVEAPTDRPACGALRAQPCRPG